MAQASQSLDVLSNQDNIKILANIMKTNVSACSSIGSFYNPQIVHIFFDMLGLYRAVSSLISGAVDKEGLQPPSPSHSMLNILSRGCRHQDAEDPAAEDCEEGNTQTNGNLCQKSRRPRLYHQ